MAGLGLVLEFFANLLKPMLLNGFPAIQWSYGMITLSVHRTCWKPVTYAMDIR